MPQSSNWSNTDRICLHQHDADFNSTLIGNGLNISEENVAGVNSTNKITLEESTKRTHPNIIKHIYLYWEVHFPDHYVVGVRSLYNKELLDQNFFWKKKKDLVYQGFNTKFLKAFLLAKMKKANRKLMSFETIHKYCDSVQYRAREEDTLLPVSFDQEKDKFLFFNLKNA